MNDYLVKREIKKGGKKFTKLKKMIIKNAEIFKTQVKVFKSELHNIKFLHKKKIKEILCYKYKSLPEICKTKTSKIIQKK